MLSGDVDIGHLEEREKTRCGILPRMKLSSDRVLTTHVGVCRAVRRSSTYFSKRNKASHTIRTEFDRVMAEAVSETVQRQVEIGIDIVSDGETSKIGYATYIKDRLTGFHGDSPRQIALDLQDYPEFRARMAVFAGKQAFKRQSCVGPIRFAGHAESGEGHFASSRRLAEAWSRMMAFMNAASPGVVSAFQPNALLPDS